MPHDRNGVELKVGDLIKVPVRDIRSVQVETNPDVPGEYAPIISLFPEVEEPPVFITGKVEELYPQADGCNGEYSIDGAQVRSLFNTRLVEKQ